MINQIKKVIRMITRLLITLGFIFVFYQAMVAAWEGIAILAGIIFIVCIIGWAFDSPV